MDIKNQEKQITIKDVPAGKVVHVEDSEIFLLVTDESTNDGDGKERCTLVDLHNGDLSTFLESAKCIVLDATVVVKGVV